MKKALLALIVSSIGFCSFGQQVQWASKVLDFSSELTPVQYSAQQALGKPNVLPAGGQNPNAWTPDKPKRSEFIKLGFETPMQIKQIVIAESFNPSALFKVFLYDETGKEHLINTFNPTVVPKQAMLRNIFMELTAFKVVAVKLEFDGSALPDYFSLDAVAISDSHFRVIADIDIPDLLSKGLLVEQLDKNVNSNYNEMNPLLSPDGKTLYFSRQNHPQNAGGVNDKEDIWYSELGADGKWTLAKNMGPQFNNEYPNFVNAVSAATPDGKSVVLLLGNRYEPNGKMLAGVSISDNIGGKWTAPKPIRIQDDYNFNEKANYFLTNTRKALLLSVEREDSRGGRDLYVSFPKDDSTWTRPLNLGKVINTAGEETAPFLASDDKTLYFSSNGFSGYGGSDIYVSTRLDSTWTNWSSPENMGPDINSKLDDLFFNIPSTSGYAYYSRGVTAENNDIYRVKMPLYHSPDPIIVIRGKLIDSKTGKPIGAKIIYEELPSGKEAGITYSNPETGEYEIHLPGGKLYGFRAEAAGHISESQSLDLRNYKNDGVVQSDIRLAPIEVATIEDGAKIVLNNIFFDFDRTYLRPESNPELDRLVKLMNERPSMLVEIAGHTDPLGPASYNLLLSERRANAVGKYLIKQGIDHTRITITFYGETMLIDKTNTKAGNAKNRRVEFKIIKL